MTAVEEPDLNQLLKGQNSTVTSDEMAEKFHEHMVGKTVLITGVAPTGLGAEVTRIISLHQPKLLILASRRTSAIEQVIADLHKEHPATKGVHFEALELDLADYTSIRAAAAKAISLAPAIDVLINNAGVMMVQDFETTPAGVERQFGTNHIGHFLFTNLIVPALLKSKEGPRVVNVSSSGYQGSSVKCLDDPTLVEDTPASRAAYNPFTFYGQSKTANLLFSLGLAQRLGKKGLVAIGMDPGAIGTTNLSRHVPLDFQIQGGWRLANGDLNPAMPFITAQISGATYVKAAYDPELKEHNGCMLKAAEVADDVLPYARDPEAADKLWALSEKLVGQEFRY